MNVSFRKTFPVDGEQFLFIIVFIFVLFSCCIQVQDTYVIYLGTASNCTLQNILGLCMSASNEKRFFGSFLEKSFIDNTDFHSFSDQSFNIMLCKFFVSFCYVMLVH